MKRKYGILLLVLLTVLLSFGCGKAEKGEGASASGKTLTVVLSADPSVGYSWNYEISDQDVLSFAGERYAKETESASSGTGFDTFTFTGGSEGTAVLTLTYGEQWESGRTGRTVKLTVATDAKGNVTVTESDLAASSGDT